MPIHQSLLFLNIRGRDDGYSFSDLPLPLNPINKLDIHNKISISLSVYCLALSFFLLIYFGISFQIHPSPLDLLL